MHGSTRSFILGAILAALVPSVPSVAHAEDAPPAKGESRGFATEGSVMAGLTQWVLFRGGNVAGAKYLGKTIAERLLGKGIKQVVFDRNGYLYHGRIRAVADAAREAGLEF